MIITNSVDLNNFKSFTASLNNKVEWTGEKSVVLFSSDAVLELHNQYALYQNEIRQRQNKFYDEFFNLLQKVDPERGYSYIQKDEISGLFKSVIALAPELVELDTAKVAKQVKSEKY